MRKTMHLSEERPTTTLSFQVPVDVRDDLEKVAQTKEMSSIEALLRFYVGQGLRKDLAELRRKESAKQAQQILGKYHIDQKIIEEVMAVVS